MKFLKYYKKYSLFLFAVIALTIYGGIVVSAIEPGQTLDPIEEGFCNSVSDPNCTIDILGGDSVWSLTSNDTDIFFDEGLVGIGLDNPLAQLHIQTGQVFVPGTPTIPGTPGSIASVDYTGSGLDDAEFSGDYDGVDGCFLIFGIWDTAPDNGFANDRIAYGGNCGGLDIPDEVIEIIPGVPMPLVDLDFSGISVTFENGTGHSPLVLDGGGQPVDNFYYLTFTEGTPEIPGTPDAYEDIKPFIVQNSDADELFSVDGFGSGSFARALSVGTALTVGNQNVSIGGVGYNFPDTQGGNGQVLTNDGTGILTWEDVSGGGGGGDGDVIVVGNDSLVSSLSEQSIPDDRGMILLGTSAGANIGDGTSAYSNFIGRSAGANTINVLYSNFIGEHAGSGAFNASDANFIGRNAGSSATTAAYSNFFGYQAGQSAGNAEYSNFFGYLAGQSAGNAEHSNFFGAHAGYEAINAYFSNFIGNGAGYEAINAQYSNFFGNNTGVEAFNANDSNFFGQYAGYQATDAQASNFLGGNAGYGATNANNSNFFGSSAGLSATSAHNSNFFGSSAGLSATSAHNSNFFGNNAGFGATSANNSNFIGENAGFGAETSYYSTFIGRYAGAYNGASGSMYANNSIFIGNNAGFKVDDLGLDNSGGDTSILIGDDTSTGGFSNSIAIGAGATNTATNQFLIGQNYTQFNMRGINWTMPDAQGGVGTVLTNDGSGNLTWESVDGGSSPISLGGDNSDTLYSSGVGAGVGDPTAGFNIFLGASAGAGSAASYYSNFIGRQAGLNSHASYSNFFGISAGSGATHAFNSNFIGASAGGNATNANHSNFLGYHAGLQAEFANNSIFIGYQAGMTDFASGSTLSNNSIFIGNNAGFTVGDLGLDNSMGGTSILIGDDTSTGGYSDSIAIGKGATNTTTNQFMIGGGGSQGVDQVYVNGNAVYSVLDTGTGWTHMSDERMKTNITDLPSVLEILSGIRTVSYNRLADPDGDRYIGFLAQNLETAFPELVRTNSDGYKSVYYELMTPILTKAIKELDLKVSLLESQTESSGGFSLASLTTLAKDFLADVGNGIQNIFAKKITTEELCVGNTCISESELIEVLELRQGLQSNTGITQQVESGQQDNNEESGVQDDESIDEITEDVQKNASDSSEPDDESLKNDAPIEEFSDQDPVDGSVMNSENEAENIEESVAGVDE